MAGWAVLLIAGWAGTREAKAEEFLYTSSLGNKEEVWSNWEPYLGYSRLDAEQWYVTDKLQHNYQAVKSKEAHDAFVFHKGGQEWTNYEVKVKAALENIKAGEVGVAGRVKWIKSPAEGQYLTGYFCNFSEKRAILYKFRTAENCRAEEKCVEPALYLNHFSNPTVIKIIEKEAGYPGWVQYAEHEIGIKFTDDKIQCLWDGQSLIEEKDEEFNQGGIGLFTYKAKASFKNLEAKKTYGKEERVGCQIESQDGYWWGEAVKAKGKVSSGWPLIWKWELRDQAGKLVGVKEGKEVDWGIFGEGKYTVKLRCRDGKGQEAEDGKEIEIFGVDNRQKQGMGKMKTYWRDDYRFGNYKGALYAESRPEDALIVEWPNGVKLVFWQEASFVPFIEFPDGMGVTMQFMEGANGSGELFNRFGRMKKNSWPEILGETENKVIVRWHYFDVNMDSGERVGEAIEDYICFSDGQIVRRVELLWGGSFEPMEIMVLNPKNVTVWNWLDKQTTSWGGKNWYPVYKIWSVPEEIEREWWWKPVDLNKSEFHFDGAKTNDFKKKEGGGVLLETRPWQIYVGWGEKSGLVDPQIIPWENVTHFVHWPIGWLNSEWKKGSAGEVAEYPNHSSIMGVNHSGYGPYYWLILPMQTGEMNKEKLIKLTQSWLEDPDTAPCEARGNCQKDVVIPIPTSNQSCATCPGRKNQVEKGGNCNGKVDIADFSLWRGEYLEQKNGSQKTEWRGDFNCNGKVDIADFSLWRGSFLYF